MLRILTSAAATSARQHIAALLMEHAEWFISLAQGETYALRRNELDVAVSQGRLLLNCWTETGSKSWRILSWEWNGQALTLHT